MCHFLARELAAALAPRLSAIVKSRGMANEMIASAKEDKSKRIFERRGFRRASGQQERKH